MKVDRWFSVLAFAAASCLATPGPDGSAPKEDSQAHEPGAGTDESELSFVAGLSCTDNDECGRRSYCQYPTGQCGGAGTCQTRPKICAESDAPVCGCDGRTHASGCAAAGAGASVKDEGECAPPGASSEG